MAPVSPTVARWEITSRTRTRREELDITGSAVAKHLGFTTTYWSKVESDRRLLSEDKLTKLVDFLDFDKQERSELLALHAVAKKQRGWWMNYSYLFGDDQMRLWGLEYGAEEISCFDSLLFPGLLQTPAYARALMDADPVFIPKKEIEARVQFRMLRQNRLDGPDPLKLNVVLCQPSLLYQMGSATVLREQLQHLAKSIREAPTTLDVRVIPFDAPGGYSFGGATYQLLDFGNPQLPMLGWREAPAVSGIVEHPHSVRDLSVAFEHAQDMSLDQERSLALIEESAERLESSS